MIHHAAAACSRRLSSPWRSGWRWLLAVAALALPGGPAAAQVVPPEFVDEVVVRGLSNPTAMAFAPDGRLVITEQAGTARLVVGGVLQATPFASLTVDSVGERGLLGVAFHPNFVTNGFVYFYHTVPAAGTTPPHNRVTRFTVVGNAVDPGSATAILDLENLTARTNHNGGALQFGKDGKLYVGVGDNDRGANAQTLTNRLGKILRINADGTIPGTNPLSFSGVTGNTANAARAIWAIGLRNPFSLAIHPHLGTIMINDVGELTFEELNQGVAGANYGWPNAEGPATNASYTSPIYSYRHTGALPRPCAITGGTFYSPAQVSFPATYVDRYFFADYCANWIQYIDPANPGTATLFASGLNAPLALAVDSTGALYYLQRGDQTLHRIRYTGTARQRLLVTPQQFDMAEGTTQTVSVRLGSRPTADVTIKIDRSLSDYLITQTPSSFTFTPNNWDVPQLMTVTAKPDGDAIDESARFLMWSPIGIPSVRVRVTAVDDDRIAGAPRAIISRPRAGDVVSGTTAEFFGDGYDDGSLVRAQFVINNVVAYTDENTTGHYHIGGDHNLWDTTQLPNGDYTLRLTVRDNLGRIGTHEIRVRVTN